MKNTIRFLFALAPALAAAQDAAPLAEVTQQLGPLDGAVYFEAGAVDRPGDGVARWFTRLADLLETAAADDPLPVDPDFLEALRKIPLLLDFAGANSVRAFGRVVRPDGDGAFRHRSFWAGGEGNRAWDLLAAEAPAPADCIPASAILAFASSADPRALWELAREALAEADPDTLASFDKALAAVRAGMGIDVTNLVANLRPGVFWAATADPAKPVEFDGIGVPLPSPGFVYGVGCETRDLLATAATLMSGMGFRIQFEEKGPDGSEGFVVPLPDEAADELPFEFLATVRWSPAKKMVVFASTPALACNALEDVAAPKLVDSPAFKELAAGLPADGSLRWVSPEFVKLAATVFANSDGVPDGFRALFSDPADFWYVARSRRLPGGLLSESRSPLPSPANVRAMQESLGGVAAVGVVAGLFVPAVQSTTSSAKAVRTGNAGRNVVQAILMANMDREAAGKSSAWPTKGKWDSSSAYFARLLDRRLLDGISAAEVTPFYGGVAWCCLAGIEGESATMPFLWSPNLELDENDFARPVDPARPVDWSGKVSDDEPVVLVRKGGAMQVIKPNLLTDVAFFCGQPPLHPENLEVLSPEPGGL
ncbi:MAG: hypothetical protein II839_03955 [Kiritimatiellae bacterium]|nr:hypothetical protein [Kiritimatiellia bacterium]